MIIDWENSKDTELAKQILQKVKNNKKTKDANSIGDRREELWKDLDTKLTELEETIAKEHTEAKDKSAENEEEKAGMKQQDLHLCKRTLHLGSFLHA